MTTPLEGGGGSASRPGRSLPAGKTRYPLYERLGELQGRSGQVGKNLAPTGIRSRTVQPVASRYTDCGTRPTNLCKIHVLIIFLHLMAVFLSIQLQQVGLRYFMTVLCWENLLKRRSWSASFRWNSMLISDIHVSVHHNTILIKWPTRCNCVG